MMDKLVKRSFAFISVTIALLLYLAYTIPQNKVYCPAENVDLYTLTPITANHPEKAVTVYTFDVSDRASECDTLFVQSKHSEVRVSANGEPLYSLERGKHLWMNTVGTVYDFVYLPEHINLIEVTVTNLYPNVKSARAIMSVGNGSEIFQVLTSASFFPTIISITEIFIGAILLIFWYKFRRQGQSQKELFYLAWFSVAVGTWSLSGSVNFVLISKNQAAASALSFISLMFFVVPFIQFTKHHFGYNKRFADIVSLSAIISTVMMIALHMLGIVGLKQSLIVTHSHIAVISLFYIYSFTRFVIEGKQNHGKVLNIFASVILMGSTAIDFILYFLGNMQLTSAGRFGFIIYFFILGTESISDMVASLQESRKATIYKELAYTDNLTKLLNRNAFNEVLKTMIDPGPVSVVNIDLNDLKKCNDTYGHITGDKYIVDSAHIISDTFKDHGECYRIGGDEFAILINAHYSATEIDALLKYMEEKENDYNRDSELVQMHMAYGYATFDPTVDKNMESVCIRADAKMYAHKHTLKEKTGGEIR